MHSTTFTVFFDDPFWVGILEIAGPDGTRAARHVFGAEPTGPELYAFGHSSAYERLARQAQAGPPAATTDPLRPTANPKRAARLAAREQRAPRTSTAAQEAIKAALEQNRTDRSAQTRAERDAANAHRRRLARAKAKARHRGR